MGTPCYLLHIRDASENSGAVSSVTHDAIYHSCGFDHPFMAWSSLLFGIKKLANYLDQLIHACSFVHNNAVHTFIFINKGAYNASAFGRGYSFGLLAFSTFLERLHAGAPMEDDDAANVRYWRRMAIVSGSPVGLLVVMLAIYWWFLCCRNGFCSWLCNDCPNYMCIPCMKFGVPFFGVSFRDLCCPVVSNRPDHAHAPGCKRVCHRLPCFAPLTKDVSKGCHAPYPRNNAFRARMLIRVTCILLMAMNYCVLQSRDVVQSSSNKVAAAAARFGDQFLELEEHARHLNESAGLILARSAEAMRSDSPTSYPTVTSMPSPGPSRLPTLVPSPHPSRVPTIKPTADPTLAPAPSPTFAPSWLPTLEPSPVPSASLIDVYEPDGSVSSINLRRL